MSRESQNLQNAQIQQQAPVFQPGQRQSQEDALRNGLTLEEYRQLEEIRTDTENTFFQELLKNEKYAQLKELQDYVNARNKKAWTQNFDECGKKAAEIDAKFRNLYFKHASEQNWEEGNAELAELNEESRNLMITMRQRDNAQEEIRNSTTFTTFNTEIKELIASSRLTDSDAYDAIIKVAREYDGMTKDLSKQMELIWRLQACMKEYAKLRYKTSYKLPKGRERMARITKLLAMSDKLLEYQDMLALKEDNTRARAFLENEAKTNEKDEFIECIGEFNKTRKKEFQLDDRWPQALLPYKRDSQNKVTAETKENYEIDRKLLRAFQEDNPTKRIAAIARVYLKQNLPEFTEDDLSKDNIFNFEKELYSKNTLLSNRTILCDLISEVAAQMDGPMPPLLAYMSQRLSDPCRSIMHAAYQLRMQSLGIDTNSDCKFTKEIPEAMIDAQIQSAKASYAMRTPLNNDFESQLRQLIQKVDAEEEREKMDPNSHVYARETSRLLVLRSQLADNVSTLFSEKYPDYVTGANEYWVQNERLVSLMLPYSLDKGPTFEKSRKNIEYNDKMVRLLHSENAEDRIAALASVYLRIHKFAWKNEAPTMGEVAEYCRKMAETDGFTNQYLTLKDYLKDENERTPNHPLIMYMQSIIDRPADTYLSLLQRFYRAINGYDHDGKYLEDDDDETNPVSVKNASKEGYASALTVLIEEMDKEKAANNGSMIQQNQEIENQMKHLCKSKGLM